MLRIAIGLVVLMTVGPEAICSQSSSRETQPDKGCVHQAMSQYLNEQGRVGHADGVRLHSGDGRRLYYPPLAADSRDYVASNLRKSGPATVLVRLQAPGDSLRKKLEDQFWDDVNHRRYQAAGFVERTIMDLSAAGPGATIPQFSGQKSDAELARMTPEQHVQEYCDEYYHHAFYDHEYTNLLESYVLRDGTEAIPSLTKIVDQYDPNSENGSSRKANAWSFAAEGLLSQLDEGCIRLRATDEGKRAIEAMERLAQRLQPAAPNGPKGNNDLHQSEGPRRLLQNIQDTNGLDEAIQDTLRIKYNIALSDDGLRGFVKYLIVNDPRYPGWAKTEDYSNSGTPNAGGTPSHLLLVKNHDRIHRLYLSYKAGTHP